VPGRRLAKKAGIGKRLLKDFGRTAVRNLEKILD
jgi:hypothetical protein